MEIAARNSKCKYPVDNLDPGQVNNKKIKCGTDHGSQGHIPVFYIFKKNAYQKIKQCCHCP